MDYRRDLYDYDNSLTELALAPCNSLFVDALSMNLFENVSRACIDTAA